MPIFFSLTICATHPLLVVPIDLLPDNEKVDHGVDNYHRILSDVPSPMYYSGTADNEQYFFTKRVEVNMNFSSLHPHQDINLSSDMNNDDVLLAVL